MLPGWAVPHSLRSKSYWIRVLIALQYVAVQVARAAPPVNYRCWAVRYLRVEGVHLRKSVCSKSCLVTPNSSWSPGPVSLFTAVIPVLEGTCSWG